VSVEHERSCHAAQAPLVATTHAERRTRWVVGLTAAMMIAEIVVGTLTHSLALVADGWHMATHAGALGLAALAYWYARTRARAAAFAFGTGKVYALAGFTNAVILLLVALAMMTEGVARLLRPEKVSFAEALPVAVVGLLVNLGSFFLLHPGEHGHAHAHGHEHGHAHAHGHEHGHAHARGHEHGHDHGHDVNLKAAYLHVLADALTSLTAIAALLGGRYFGWVFLDPAMAILGSVVIFHWGIGLVRQSGRQLLDIVPSPEAERLIRRSLEGLGADVRDLHVWELGPGRRGCVVTIWTDVGLSLQEVRAAILTAAPIDHLTVEIELAAPESRAAF
jgi:cation diffusion facilitator family transporter